MIKPVERHRSRHSEGGNGGRLAQPLVDQQGREIQDFKSLVRIPNGLDERVCHASVASLNHILADTLVLRDLYKKHHWQVAGPTFYQLHLLFDQHFEAQSELVNALAKRMQMLGGISIAMGADVAEELPAGRRAAAKSAARSRLLAAHEMVLKEAHHAAQQADKAGDDGTADLLVSQVIRTNEMQVWFLAEHLVDTPLVRAD